MPTEKRKERGWTRGWVAFPAALALLFAMGSGPCETCDPGSSAPGSAAEAAAGAASERAGSLD